MRLRWGLYLAILVAPVISATTIDLSSETSILVHTGDTLIFQVSTGSFGVNAAAFGLPLYPEDVSFALASDPLSGLGGFSATLESADGEVSVGFDSLTSGLGFFQGTGYAGDVSTLQGYLRLSPLLSEALFSAPSAIIALRNEGADVTVGLSSYLLRQDLYVGLSAGPLSVGAAPGLVELKTQETVLSAKAFGTPLDLAPDSAVPEPQTGGLLFGGGALLCGLSAVLARITRGRA